MGINCVNKILLKLIIMNNRFDFHPLFLSIPTNSVMDKNSLLKFAIEKRPNIKIGDKIRIKIIEGDKERVQYFTGIVISKTINFLFSNVTVRKSLEEIGVERIFSINSPKIYSIFVFQSSKVRRSKLYFLRNLKGKATRLGQSF